MLIGLSNDGEIMPKIMPNHGYKCTQLTDDLQADRRVLLFCMLVKYYLIMNDYCDCYSEIS